jgi:DNA-binding NarL/FixJ family response regulator
MMLSSKVERGIVLVVDDSPDTLRMLIEAIEGAGLTTLVARSGQAALDLLERIQPDVILLDAMMPGIDGFETCRRIKARRELATTPVVFMTGMTDRASVAQALTCGAVDYVAKPVAPDELIARIAVHVVNARLIADARQAADAAGRGVAAFSHEGLLAWATPRAAELLAGVLDDPDVASRVRVWLAAVGAEALSHSAELALTRPGGGGVNLNVIGRAASSDILVRVRPIHSETTGAFLSRTFGITPREGEVLGWLAQGKSNNDIATILRLSPRTITKHIEQIFTKIGVENRTSAAAMAIRSLEAGQKL